MISERISEFADFFAKNYMAELTQAKGCIIISFTSLSEWNVDLASELLGSPEDYLKMANKAIQTLIDEREITVRFTGLPNTQNRNVWETRKEDVGKFIALTGIINKSSSIIHLCETAKFECSNCGTVMSIVQNDGKFTEPSKCNCGRKGKMNLIDKEFTDIIKLGVIDDLMARENVDRSIAREKLAILSQDLTSLEVDQKIKPGKKVVLNGYFKYQQKSGSAEFDSIFHVNSMEFVQVGWDTVKVNTIEESQIKMLAKQDDIINRLAESIADVEGFAEAKKACLLMLAGAPHKYDENGHLVSRGTTHILLIGNPGGGKTFLAKRAGSISPVYSFASAATASGKGLVAAVSQDKDIGAWVIYPGVVAMANKGVCISGNQKIMTSRGLLSIKDVKQDDKILSFGFDGVKEKHVSGLIFNGVKEVVQLTLYSGDTITCTPDHRIMTSGGWKPAGDLTTKDYIKNYFTSITNFENREDIEDGWLFGFALSDVWYNTSLKKGSKNCVRNVMSYSSSIINKERSEYVHKLLIGRGIRSIHVKNIPSNKHLVAGKQQKFKEGVTYRFSDKKLHNEIKDMMESNLLVKSTDDFYAGFLAGILSTDACISHKKGKYGIKHEIAVTLTRYNKSSQTKEWNRNIQILVNSLFHRFGILSCIRGDKIIISSLTSYNLCVSLLKEFMVGKNKEKLYHVLPKKRISSYDDWMDDEYVKWFCSIKFKTSKTVKYGLHSSIWYSRKKKRVSSQLMNILFKFWEEITDEEFWPPAKDYLLNKIISVERAGSQEVYDITIPENHNFMLTGGLAHNCVIDEVDKTHKDDYGDHNNAMNDMECLIAKGNVKGKLETETSYLATANPENRIFSSYDTYANQIDMPKDFQDRFDLILPMVSPTDKKAQEKIMDIMLGRHTDDKSKKSWNPEFTHNFIQKYVAYCRRSNPNPILSPELFAYIKKKLIELMKPRSEEQSMISFRHLESILRFEYGAARLRLRDITEEDVDLAFNLKKKSFIELGIISEAGGFSWAKLEEVEEKVISEKEIIHNILRELMPDGSTMAEWHEIIKRCTEKGIEEDKAEEHIQKLITKGDYFEPKRGFLRRI